MNKIKVLAIAMLFLSSLQSYSQGCSDAGFCTMGTLAPASSVDTVLKHLAKLSLGFGIGEQGTRHINIVPEFEFSFFKKNILQIKVPYISVNGNLGSNSGIGDLSLSISQGIYSGDKSQLSITAGAKLPTGTTGKSKNGISLPMPYQTGLGTTDLILGLSYRYQKWNIGVGYQKVLRNGNKNKFLHSSDSIGVQNDYFESNLLNRGDDALLRIERNFDLKKIKITAGLLTIYRLQKDKITDVSINEIALSGSDGVTLNVTGNFLYNFSKHSGVNFLFGAPVMVRKTRADGLTRGVVLSASYLFRFGK